MIGVRCIGTAIRPAIRFQKILYGLRSQIRRYTNNVGESDGLKTKTSEPDTNNEFSEDAKTGASSENDSISPQKNQEFDKILDSLVFHFDELEAPKEANSQPQVHNSQETNDKPEFDLSLFESLLRNADATATEDISFEDEEENGFKMEDDDIIDEEKKLFGKVFQTYLKDESNKNDKAKRIEYYSSIKKSKEDIDNLINLTSTERKQSVSFDSVSAQFKQQFFDRTKLAINPTLNHIDHLRSVEAKLEFLNAIIARFQSQIKTPQGRNEIFLGKQLRKNSKNFTAKHESLIDSMSQTSIKLADSPVLNVFTIPLIFNKTLHSLSFQNYQGTLALSLYNLLKKDVNLYTVFINQQTFNEILRINWIFNGKLNLHGIEMIFLEMVNNGFTGDIMTYKIIKQVLLDYCRLRIGNYSGSTNKDVPIWTEEDNKRFKKLVGKTHQLANELGLPVMKK